MRTIKNYNDFLNEEIQDQVNTTPEATPETKKGMMFPKGTFSNTNDTFVTFTKFENNVKTGATKPRNDGSYSVSVSTDQTWKNTPFEINCYISKDGNKIESIWYNPSEAKDYLSDKIKDWSPLLQYIMVNNK